MTDRPLAVGISGSPHQRSKSKALLETLLEAFARRGCAIQLIDLSQLPAEALLARGQHPEVDAALRQVGQSRFVVAASPTYRALYTGLLKSFFDLMPPSHLAGKLCVGVQTAAAQQHALAIDYGLRLLFISLEGVPLAALFATDNEFVDGRPSDALLPRAEQVAEQALSLIR